MPVVADGSFDFPNIDGYVYQPPGLTWEYEGGGVVLSAENRALLDVLLARQRLAEAIADAKADLRPDDFRAALETGDREKLLALLTDLPAELSRLDSIRAAAAELAPDLPAGLAPLLWREYFIPWTRRSEVDHLLAP